MKYVFLLDILILIASFSNVLVYTIRVKDPWIPVKKLFEWYDWPKRQGALDSRSHQPAQEPASEEVETQAGQKQGEVRSSQPLHEPNSQNLTVPIENVQLPQGNSSGSPDQPYPIAPPSNFYPPMVTDSYPPVLIEPIGPDQSSLWYGNAYPWQDQTYPRTLGQQMVSPSTSFVNASGPQFPTVPMGLHQPLPLGEHNFGPPTLVMGPENQYFPPSPQHQMIPPVIGQDNLGPPIPMIVMVPEVPYDPLVPYNSIAPVGPHPSVG